MKPILPNLMCMLCCALLSLVSCHKHEPIRYSTTSDHTLLMYMIGDNTLSGLVDNNLRSAISGLKQSETPLNLVVFRDNYSGKPQLFQIKVRSDRQKVDTVYLKRWDESARDSIFFDATDPEIMAEIIDLTFDYFDTPIKGIEFWSHGFSWIPKEVKSQHVAPTRSLEYIGMDYDNTGDIWDLRKGLEKANVHFNYMMFDACFSNTAEVAYEWRKYSDYMLGSCTEIMGDGFPYRNMLQSLSTITDKESVENGLVAAFENYQTMYAKNGTFSVIRTAGIERLYEACLELQDENQATLEKWKESPRKYEANIQRYGRDFSYSRYFFYDIGSWADHLAKDSASATLTKVHEALRDCVVSHYHSAEFSNGTDPIILKESCGMGMSIPQFWQLSGRTDLDEAYQKIQWQLK